MKWEDEDQHSIIAGKVAELCEGSDTFTPGAKVSCQLREGVYLATVITAGIQLLLCSLACACACA